MFQVISDGPCDFTKKEAEEYNVKVVPAYITFDGESYLKEGVEIDTEDYFKRLLADKTLRPKSAQPNPQDYIDACTPYLKDGKDVIIVTISSKLSGSNSSAQTAAEMLKEEYPNRTVHVMDSQSVTIGQSLIIREILKMRDAGYSFEDTIALAEKVRATTRIYVTLDTLEFLRRGGRVGPTTALVGGILGLRPILQVENGEVSQLDSIRGKKSAYKLMTEGVVASLADVKDDISISVGHIMSENDAIEFKASIEEALGVQISTPITKIGASVGTHAGPGAMGFAYCRKYNAFNNCKGVVA